MSEKRRFSPRVEDLESRLLLAGDLRITEINFNPHPSMVQFGERDADADDYEFIEVANVGDAPLQLDDYEFTEGVEFKFNRQIIQPGEQLLIVQDPREFTFRYGAGPRFALGDGGGNKDPGEFGGNIRNSGELIRLEDARGNVVQEFTFYDSGEWPRRADGGGSTLEVVDPLGDPNDPKNWRASTEYGGSPGALGTGPIGDVLINELLTHTDLPDVDTIELLNRSANSIDIGGWYITDSLADPFRYVVPEDTVIDSEEYITFDEDILGFSFRGQEADNAFIIEPDVRGKPIRIVDAVSYSATQNGITLGRWEDGIGDLFPMLFRTFEEENSGPLISDVVISEVHYNPPAPVGIHSDDLEFVEITNNSGVPLDLSQWQLSRSVEFTIPTGFILLPNTSIVIVGFDPIEQAAKTRRFVETYGVADDVAILGPYSDADDPNADQLDDDGETLILQRPEDIEKLGLGYVLVDRVTYRDSGEWPDEADGGGRSLTRSELRSYGDFAENWVAAFPTPGGQRVVGDVSEDGVVDDKDIDQLCIALSFGGNPAFDLNHDGSVDKGDFDFLVGTILGSVIGDSNLDGTFNSTDFVTVFAAGEYEDAFARNSGWAEGDWNCDGDFNTRDLVDAFQAQTFERNAIPLVNDQIAVYVDAESKVAIRASRSSIPAKAALDRGEFDTRARSRILDSLNVDSLFSDIEKPDQKTADELNTSDLS